MQLLNCGYCVPDKMNNFPKQIVSIKCISFNYFGAIVTFYFLFLYSHYWSIYEEKLEQLLIGHVA